MIKVGNVAMVPLNNIDISERARKVMGDLDNIESSMKERGLITPLAVKHSSNGRFLLLAGERRYIVLKKNNTDMVPVRVFDDDISDIEIKSIELAENLYRKDFEYWEHDNLVREIHELQQTIHGVKAPGPGQDGWGTGDTGQMLGATKASVSTAIKRANARDAFPELFDKCKTQRDASKIIAGMEEAVIKDALVKKIEADTSSDKVTANSRSVRLSNCYILQDFFDGIKTVEDEVMHLVEIDPPYGIDLKSIKMAESIKDHSLGVYNEVDACDYQVFLANVFTECYRVMTKHSWLVCWFAPEPWFEIVYQELNNAGFNTTRMCGIWNKGYGQSMHPEIYMANTYEMFFYAWKGRPALNKPGRSNVFDFAPVPPQKKIHPTERPVELMKEIYDVFAFKGSRILIPFLGSGNGILAADELGMSASGFEKAEEYRNSYLLKIYT